MNELKFRKELSKKEKRFLQKALELSELSSCHFKHGAIIVRNGNVVSVGINYLINDPYFLEDSVAAEHAAVHAEVAALNSCRKADLEGATIYVARSNKKGDPMMSKPCPRCQKALKKRGVKKVCYTIDSSMSL